MDHPDHAHHVTWLIVAVAMALGKLLTNLLRPISPGQEVEAIVT